MTDIQTLTGRYKMGFISKVVKTIDNIKLGYTSAIILCAGNSTRFGNGSENKQMAQVGGKGVAERTISVFERCKSIKEIILVVRKDDLQKYKELIIANDFKKIRCIVVGGDTRQNSAFRGFRHISEKTKYVVFHDGARCLVTEEIIDTVLKKAVEYNAASAAYKSVDTVKWVDEDEMVKRTLDRDFVWSVQTPQAFDAKIYKVSAYNARQKNIEVTDDCMLLEKAGFKVKLVDTGRENIKITVKEDIDYAEYIILKRGENKDK